mgnify:FL=1
MITADDHLLRMGFQMPVDEHHKPAKLMKEGCLMIFKGLKDFIKLHRLNGISVNLGLIGLNFAGGSS